VINMPLPCRLLATQEMSKAKEAMWVHGQNHQMRGVANPQRHHPEHTRAIKEAAEAVAAAAAAAAAAGAASVATVSKAVLKQRSSALSAASP